MPLADIAPSSGPGSLPAPLLVIGIGVLVVVGIVVLVRMARSRRKD